MLLTWRVGGGREGDIIALREEGREGGREGGGLGRWKEECSM